MNTKKLVYSSMLCGLSITTLFIMFMPIVESITGGMSVFNLVGNIDSWMRIQEYLFGIAGLIATIILPILILSSVVCILSALGIIKSKKLDKALYIVNIVLSALVVATIVNYFLGLGRTVGMSGLKLFKGPTYFDIATAFFYLHCVFSIAMLVVACLNFSKTKTKAKKKK